MRTLLEEYVPAQGELFAFGVSDDLTNVSSAVGVTYRSRSKLYHLKTAS